MKVLKFGGSSVGTPERIREVRQIVLRQELPCIVVVSAFQSVTDQLQAIAHLAAQGDPSAWDLLKELTERHRSAAEDLVRGKEEKNKVFHEIEKIIDELTGVCTGVFLVKELTRHSLDLILSAGERLSAGIIAAYFGQAWFADARDFIRAETGPTGSGVDFTETNRLISEILKDRHELVIVPGFIASDKKGETVTLGRGGSDYSAAIIAAALGAEMLEIWTDVEGFMTADPKKVDKAYTIESLSYSEAMELSHFGAKVIYTPTLRPVYKAGIPVLVRNTFNPSSKGTLINGTGPSLERSPIKGISSIDNIDLLTLQGPAMVGVTGTSARLFGALAGKNVNVILITQASSEYSITFAVNPSDTDKASEAIISEFEREIIHNKELKIVVEKNMSVIAIVGERMKNTPGVSATLFKALGINGINVVATAQGSSELNISVVLRNENLRKALNVIHDGFFLSLYKEMNLFVAGTGVVGSSLLKQIKNQAPLLFKERHLKINILGIANSRKMLIDPAGIKIESISSRLKDEGLKTDLHEYVGMIKKMNLRNSVFIDCTADSKVASVYGELLSGYISVVTANKIACSSEYSYYSGLKETAAGKGVRFMYETTVGAGLPIIKTINDLVISGDSIYRIEAVLSGTLNFIFNEMNEDLTLSRAIRKARDAGYSEPDPRVDLSGTDVVRKILILAREAGYPIEQKDVKVERFLPDECFEGDLNNFYSKVEALDGEFEQKRKDLITREKQWHFFATLDNGKASVGLVETGKDHPSYNLAGSNNIVLLTTERYRELPLVIKGYGAGADVTAAGIFADLMRVINV
ncbi:MAG: bifunctional aspartate kinase/homoserine dehydrogenase I [Bacteroidales bacterium]|nr:bifunctional aspartate kinase/homoserine dehydrogenase I [Bacteroidales bacterium]